MTSSKMKNSSTADEDPGQCLVPHPHLPPQNRSEIPLPNIQLLRKSTEALDRVNIYPDRGSPFQSITGLLTTSLVD